MFNNFCFFSFWVDLWYLFKNLLSLLVYKSIFINPFFYFFDCFHLDLRWLNLICLTNSLFDNLKIRYISHFYNCHAFLNESLNCLNIFSLFAPWTVWRLFFISCWRNYNMNNHSRFTTNINEFKLRSIFVDSNWNSFKRSTISSKSKLATCVLKSNSSLIVCNYILLAKNCFFNWTHLWFKSKL
jgi:hypothetical protein